MPFIDVSLKHSFGRFLCDIHLKGDFPGVIGLFGPSGSGKSTLLEHLAGFTKGMEGFVKIDGDLWQEGGRIIKPNHKRKLSYLMQQPFFFPFLSFEQNLCFGSKRDPASLKSELDHLVKEFALHAVGATFISDFSGGEKQRAAIVRGILQKPNHWLLDEPLSAVDGSMKAKTKPLLRRVLQEAPGFRIYVSHDRQELEYFADTIVEIRSGKIINVLT
ncbi:MAG: ATP-binding cassette domain-containing protein [Pseudobacteriovorax sp.]|nr:ATP-binding cassette domain-containing protein [Pseudobacteriovorax sp.]